MDFGAIIKAPTLDPDWMKKCAIMGLMCLVPIAGILNLMGWMKATYARARSGDTTLPEAGFNYIGSGWAMFLAILPPILVLMVLGIGIGIVGGVLKMRAVLALGNLLLNLLSLAVNLVITPTLVYRHVVHNTGFGDGFDMGGIMKVITTNVGLFGTFAVLYFLGGLIGGVGIVACCIGVFLTLPFGMAIHANAITAFERENGGL